MALNVSGPRVIRMLGLINLFVSNRKLAYARRVLRETQLVTLAAGIDRSIRQAFLK